MLSCLKLFNNYVSLRTKSRFLIMSTMLNMRGPAPSSPVSPVAILILILYFSYIKVYSVSLGFIILFNFSHSSADLFLQTIPTLSFL